MLQVGIPIAYPRAHKLIKKTEPYDVSASAELIITEEHPYFCRDNEPGHTVPAL